MSAKDWRCKLQALKCGNFGAKLKHLCDFWLDVFFSRVKNIDRFSDWLELIFV